MWRTRTRPRQRRWRRDSRRTPSSQRLSTAPSSPCCCRRCRAHAPEGCRPSKSACSSRAGPRRRPSKRRLGGA
ncbi:hypothetical protein EMIHUDRAFT_455190, partial [Emiliania huxleyi CCMP1516]|uniref:Uncharacterized protein n=2 Tax=Emiliania huxleyi TaxID=2903 RepID=A0A0D3KJX9_EMIH1